MNQEQSTEVAQQFISELRRLEDGDVSAAEGLGTLFADHATLTNPILQRQRRERAGRDEIAAFWREYRGTFDVVHTDFYEVAASDRAAGLFWRSTASARGGQPLEYDGATLLIFDENGKIARFQGYFDPDKLRLLAGG